MRSSLKCDVKLRGKMLEVMQSAVLLDSKFCSLRKWGGPICRENKLSCLEKSHKIPLRRRYFQLHPNLHFGQLSFCQ